MAKLGTERFAIDLTTLALVLLFLPTSRYMAQAMLPVLRTMSISPDG
jgi:hypothetical protein